MGSQEYLAGNDECWAHTLSIEINSLKCLWKRHVIVKGSSWSDIGLQYWVTNVGHRGMLGSTRTSPVCRTAPFGPSIRNLANEYLYFPEIQKTGVTDITAPGQWFASKSVIVTASLSSRSKTVGIFSGKGFYAFQSPSAREACSIYSQADLSHHSQDTLPSTAKSRSHS